MNKSKTVMAVLFLLFIISLAWLLFSVTELRAYAAPALEETGGDTWISKELQEYCREIGAEYSICPELLMAMIEVESSGREDAVNGNCVGLLQINEKWHRKRMERLGVSDLKDGYSNIRVGADYLAELFEENEGDLYLVLMKYNMLHEKAERFVEQGIYSEYSLKVAGRAEELERLHEKGGTDGKTDCD